MTQNKKNEKRRLGYWHLPQVCSGMKRTAKAQYRKRVGVSPFFRKLHCLLLMENLLNVVTFSKHLIEVSQIKNFMEIKPKYDPMAHTSHNSIETSEANAA